ncbi:MAG: hydantoinase/oxoprolinase family protein [Proteobacteria bacterium]|nr:hydantoinase/oxoprolinase family protein [Pseudomonadota bacterium]
MTNPRRLAVDVGGTFIDFVTLDPDTGSITIEKVHSAGALDEQFFEGTNKLNLDLTDLGMIVHGSTLVINTIVQENGARVGLVTTQGFRDVLELGRGSREDIYDLFYKPPPPLVPRYLRFEVPERLDYLGNIVTPLDEAAALETARTLKAAGVDSIAVCFLHAYVNPAHERRMAEIITDVFPNARISISSDVVREWREFERTNTTVLNSYTQPRMEQYLSKLDAGLKDREYQGAFAVMQSSGGITSSAIARKVPVRTIQSGPAGGVIGVRRLCEDIGIGNVVVADVGGTTFDVSLIHEGKYLERSTAKFNRRPVLQPTIDIVSIGAGGGSIAWIDQESGLRVGPESAQAEPGPACFGIGGSEPTVTDAQLTLGYLDPGTYLGKRIELDVGAAHRAIMEKIAKPLGLSLEDAAAGIVHIAAMNMAYAVRQITVERGHDPRDFSLVCIGGGGGLFAGALLRELQMKQAIVPQNAAVFSAWGLLNADYREDVTRPFLRPLAEVTPQELHAQLQVLEDEARDWLSSQKIEGTDLTIERYAEMRYLGQEHTIKVPIREDELSGPDLSRLRRRFDTFYDKAYAHALPDHDLEFVILRLVAISEIEKPPLSEIAVPEDSSGIVSTGKRKIYLADEKRFFDCDVYDRESLAPGSKIDGPVIVEEWTTTILTLLGQQVTIDRFGNLFIRVKHAAD